MGTTKQRLFIPDKPLIGIDISQHGIKVMSIDVKKWQVLGYGYVSADLSNRKTDKDDRESRIRDALNKLFKDHIIGRMPSKHAVLSIPTSRSYTRSFTLPRQAEKNLEEAVRLEAEQYIPVPLTEMNVGYQVISKTADQIEVAVAAAPNNLVNSLVSACHTVGLTVLMAEPSINSAARLVSHTEEGDLPTILLDIGSSTTDIAVLDGTIRAASSVNQGGNGFTKAIAKRLSVSEEKAHQLKVLNGLSVSPRQADIKAALAPHLDEIVANIHKIIRYYNERIDSKKEIAQIVLVGGGANVPGIGDYFTDKLVMPARIASPWQLLDFGKLPKPTPQYKPLFITAAGLASTPPKEIFK